MARMERGTLEEPGAHRFLNPGAVLRLHACGARSVASRDGRRFVREEDPMLRIARGKRTNRAPAVEVPIDLPLAVPAKRAWDGTEHFFSVWAN